jgi:hypothetical protein
VPPVEMDGEANRCDAQADAEARRVRRVDLNPIDLFRVPDARIRRELRLDLLNRARPVPCPLVRRRPPRRQVRQATAPD